MKQSGWVTWMTSKYSGSYVRWSIFIFIVTAP